MVIAVYDPLCTWHASILYGFLQLGSQGRCLSLRYVIVLHITTQHKALSTNSQHTKCLSGRHCCVSGAHCVLLCMRSCYRTTCSWTAYLCQHDIRVHWRSDLLYSRLHIMVCDCLDILPRQLHVHLIMQIACSSSTLPGKWQGLWALSWS
jgi:hypothetical protein